MQEFQKLLDEGKMFKIVGRVKMGGDLMRDERELVVYARE
jgi:hypothetical protein